MITAKEKSTQLRRLAFLWLKRALVSLLSAILLYKLACAYAPSDFFLHQRFYLGVVSQVKASSLKVGEEKEWFAERSLVGWTLRPVNKPTISKFDRVGVVSAHRKRNGYRVSIVTNDQGHFGFYGYIFSDSPLRATRDDYLQMSAPGEFATITSRLSDHWWVAQNNLQ